MRLPRLSPDTREIAACIVVAWFTIMLCCLIVGAYARVAAVL